MVEVAELVTPLDASFRAAEACNGQVTSGRNVILVIHNVEEGQEILGEKVGPMEKKVCVCVYY